ncbi:hypothetical protein RAS2_09590 [Phycisphaerae bacterium RAS2]|nr:hypothetical protein RAS2_09590 [Phycisphaerae bacterium RAS2]
MHKRTRFPIATSIVSFALLVLLTGCTHVAPDDSATILIQSGVDQVVTFAIDFARQLLAAFLF